MGKKQFKAESKRLLDLMINSIYTNKEIFLREIISNASDAIDKLCYLSLTDDKVGLSRADYRIDVVADKEARTITVRDNGIGMTEEFQKEMFHLFTQERRRAQGLNGTGLGLAIVKRLVALMNGTIQVQSRLNEGSVFTVEFACEQAQMADISKASVRLPQRTDHPLRALLCEDNTVNQLIMKRLLKSIGVDCDVADNGVDGLTMFQQSQPGWYDIILMDLRMPQMNGYEATKKIRTLLRADAANIPIVALTADAFEDDKKRCLHIGMNDFIAKPVQLSILKEKLFINISGWREKC